MKREPIQRGLLAAMAVLLAGCAGTAAQSGSTAASGVSFFVTSVGSGKGADLGGLAGADKHCQTLAAAAGAGGKTWRAYLSTQGQDGAPAVNARDRIGKGPWHNAKGVDRRARTSTTLHGAGNNLTKQTALNEKGEVVERPRRHAEPARHPHRLAYRRHRVRARRPDVTCGNWTKSGSDGAAMVGHHDRTGPTSEPVGEVVELVAPVARRLQPGGAAWHRRRRAVLLLRGRLGQL